MEIPPLPFVAAGELGDHLDHDLGASADAIHRLHERDHTLWRDDPTEIADRLGWLDAPAASLAEVDRLTAFADAANEDGLTDAVVVGMGGSSLFPDVLAQTFSTSSRRLALHVLDSTHPAAVRRAIDFPDSTLFVVASKSGTTIEPRSHLEALWASRSHLADPGSRFVAITDPGSELAAEAERRGFRDTFVNDPDIGGRFSALSLFGMVPAALLGVDVAGLLGRAEAELALCRAEARANPGYRLGVVLASAARRGRDKLTLFLPDEAASFGAWVEQLVAESLGKDGVTVAPIVGDTVEDVPRLVGTRDRLFVSLGWDSRLQPLVDANHPVVRLPWEGPLDLGAEVVRWEVATAIAGAILGVQPFDQPDVQAAKLAATRVLNEGLEVVASTPVDKALAEVREGDHLAITAFVDPASPVVQELEGVRVALRDRLGVAVSVGIGPRYLHSTGQLHKGGGDAIVVLQVLEAGSEDVAIPGQSYGFAALFAAQAQGDLDALLAAGRRAHRVPLAELLAQA